MDFIDNSINRGVCDNSYAINGLLVEVVYISERNTITAVGNF